MGTGSFPGVKSGRGVTLTPHPLLVPWSWKGRAIPLLPSWAVRPVQSLSACTRVHFIRRRPQNTKRTCNNCLTTSVHGCVWKSYSAPCGWCWLHGLAYIGIAQVSTLHSFYCLDLAVSASSTLPSVPFVRRSIATSSYVTDLKNLYHNPINLQAFGVIPLC